MGSTGMGAVPPRWATIGTGTASLTATMTEEPAQETYDSYQPYVVIPESPPEPEPIVGLIFPVWGPK